ncbi:RluA family pseudouridine synthase [Caulobacter sp. RHG1]|uniref:RluA family pseudouridine synthase n=1 Tax=Caulobacter sp. (strain RHG1) TaxID=2545762 RepID=UPI001554450D
MTRRVCDGAVKPPVDGVEDTVDGLGDDDALDTGASREGDGETLTADLPDSLAGQRLDKVLAPLFPDLSRARLQALIGEGRLSLDGQLITDASRKAKTGTYALQVPPPAPAEPEPQALPLSILYEDEHLIVVDKAAGMAVHPAPGTPDGTLVNALLHHCGDSLSGVGGVARPGIVHRLDKDTSGVMVAAKSDVAHQGLSKLFATHDIDRLYVALVRGAPSPLSGTIETQLGRSASDRKKMAVLKSGGRTAITHYKVEATFGPQDRPVAARVACRLETGRTHQIRVHMASKGSPCLADAVYGASQPAQAVRERIAAAGLTRQALHAAVLGFAHPVTGETLRFETPLPADMAALEAGLATL